MVRKSRKCREKLQYQENNIGLPTAGKPHILAPIFNLQLLFSLQPLWPFHLHISLSLQSYCSSNMSDTLRTHILGTGCSPCLQSLCSLWPTSLKILIFPSNSELKFTSSNFLREKQQLPLFYSQYCHSTSYIIC